MVLVIDNYDSFTYNIVQYLMQLGEEVKVFRNDEITLEKTLEIEFDHLVISPGPGRPETAGVSMKLIEYYTGKKPILGVCLGHQSIGQVFGGEIVSAKKIMHGKSDMVSHDGRSIFQGLPNPLKVIRYHSLAIKADTVPADFEVSARSSDGEIMAIRHKKFRVEGVQFHPESIGTEDGMKLLANFFRGTSETFHIKPLLKKISSKTDLSPKEAEYVADAMTTGEMTQAQIGAFLTALTMKGESVDEIASIARVFRRKATKVPFEKDVPCVDMCGTGGDSSGSFNISTTASFIACGAGVKVAKHGNRSITSKAGSADVLEALNVAIDLPPELSAKAIDSIGMSFLFAQKYHPAFKNIGGPRKELGFRTIFNMLGPLLNPAGATRQLMGVFDGALTEKIAHVLRDLGSDHAMIVYGSDGLDEITLTGTTRITELKNGWIRTFTFDPRQYGFEYCSNIDLKGGNPAENASIVKRILAGEKGPKRDVAIMNAAAAIIVSGIADDFQSAIEKARASLDTGKALSVFNELVQFKASLKREWE
jgi:anthranilate synthase/phosphoribosyltransferase